MMAIGKALSNVVNTEHAGLWGLAAAFIGSCLASCGMFELVGRVKALLKRVTVECVL
jgi:hypothetical protein